MLGLARRMQRNQIQIQHLLKLNPKEAQSSLTGLPIQIQHLLKLNIAIRWKLFILSDSNTTFVKVK